MPATLLRCERKSISPTATTSSNPDVAGFLGEPVQTAHPGTLYQQTNVTSDVTVIAKKEDTATITATAMDGSAEQSFELTVTKIPVDSVALDETDVHLGIGRTRQLNAILSPSDASYQGVTWAPSDENVATVDETGLVTAVGLGHATITVTTDDGAKTAQASVTVTDVLTESISLDRSFLRLRDGDSAKVTATVLPEDAKDKGLDWTTDNPAVATVSADGTVTAVANGTTTLTVSARDGGASAVSIPITVADVVNVTGVTVDPESAVTRGKRFMDGSSDPEASNAA